VSTPLSWLDRIPLWAIFLCTLGIIFVAATVGARVGRTRQAADQKSDSALGTVVGALLALAGFVLAFTFSIAIQRFDLRRDVLLRDSNAIGTAYLRTSFAPERQREECRRILREYVDLRIELSQDPAEDTLVRVLERSGELQEELWRQTVEVVKEGGDTPVSAIFVESVNEVIDIHSERLWAARSRIPGAVWLVLWGITAVSSAGVGFQFGASGRHRTESAVALALVFAVVITLVADLDRGWEGLLRIDQVPMHELRESMK
jgi:hypothetical protein